MKPFPYPESILILDNTKVHERIWNFSQQFVIIRSKDGPQIWYLRIEIEIIIEK